MNARYGVAALMLTALMSGCAAETEERTGSSADGVGVNGDARQRTYAFDVIVYQPEGQSEIRCQTPGVCGLRVRVTLYNAIGQLVASQCSNRIAPTVGELELVGPLRHNVASLDPGVTMMSITIDDGPFAPTVRPPGDHSLTTRYVTNGTFAPCQPAGRPVAMKTRMFNPEVDATVIAGADGAVRYETVAMLDFDYNELGFYSLVRPGQRSR